MTDAAFAEDEFEEPVDGEAVPEEEGAEAPADNYDPLRMLLEIARTEGDLSHLLTSTELARIGADVVEDYGRDCTSRADWEKKVKRAIQKAAQEQGGETKTYPFEKASNINYPILTEAALQFNARAYPAIVKGEEAVSIKVFGMQPKGPPPQALQLAQQEPADPQQAAAIEQARAVVTQSQEMQARWQAKLARSGRVKEFLNYTIFYQLTDWEGDTDALLVQLPIVGCAFRKVWWDPVQRKHCAALVHALRLIVPMDAKSLETTPRITEEVPDVYPYQIRERMRSGQYRTVVLPQDGDDTEAPRMLLEQYRYIDLDKDGVEEPYIVTVDRETMQVLSIQANFSAKDVKLIEGEDGAPRLVGIDKGKFYIKYDFFPHPEGKFYGIGFGHLLDQISEVIDTCINQLNDAGNAAIAGGGFIASGLRLQGANKTTRLTWKPGEFKVANIAAADLKNAIWERTIPQPSQVTFSVLDMMLGAAKDIAAIKDVITGEAPANTPVGTTLALIEQGLQVFTALYKRVYRSLKEEYGLLFDCMGKYADEELQAEYAELLDDPEADFAADFDPKGLDIRPVSDPQSVTRMQRIAKGQVLLGLTGRGLNDMAIYKRAFEAMDIEDVEELLPQGAPPGSESEDLKNKADAADKIASAKKKTAETGEILARTDAIAAADGRRVPPMDGQPGDPMGDSGAPDGGRQAA